MRSLEAVFKELGGDFFADPARFPGHLDVKGSPYSVPKHVCRRASRFAMPIFDVVVDEAELFAVLESEVKSVALELGEISEMDGNTAPQLFGETTTHGSDITTDDSAIDTHVSGGGEDKHTVEFTPSGDTVEPSRTDVIGARTNTDTLGERNRTVQYGDVTTHKETTPTYTALKSREFADEERFRLLTLALIAAFSSPGVAY